MEAPGCAVAVVYLISRISRVSIVDGVAREPAVTVDLRRQHSILLASILVVTSVLVPL